MDKCPYCGNGYKRIGTHWQHNTEHRPNLSKKQMDILKGIMMSDGTLMKTNKNARIKIDMITEDYLKYIKEKFGVFASDISVCMTEKEAKDKIKESFGYGSEAKKQFRIIIKGATEINKFRNWYSTGKKVWPRDIELTPTVLKHWYCGDGNWNNSGAKNYIRISMANEIKNTDKVNQMFENVGLPSPSNYAISETNCIAQFTVEQSKGLWEYMGEPLPGFKYKWPEKYS